MICDETCEESFLEQLEQAVRDAQLHQLKSTESVTKINEKLRRRKESVKVNVLRQRRDSSSTVSKQDTTGTFYTAQESFNSTKSTRSSSKSRISSMLGSICGSKKSKDNDSSCSDETVMEAKLPKYFELNYSTIDEASQYSDIMTSDRSSKSNRSIAEQSFQNISRQENADESRVSSKSNKSKAESILQNVVRLDTTGASCASSKSNKSRAESASQNVLRLDTTDSSGASSKSNRYKTEPSSQNVSRQANPDESRLSSNKSRAGASSQNVLLLDTTNSSCASSKSNKSRAESASQNVSRQDNPDDSHVSLKSHQSRAESELQNMLRLDATGASYASSKSNKSRAESTSQNISRQTNADESLKSHQSRAESTPQNVLRLDSTSVSCASSKSNKPQNESVPQNVSRRTNADVSGGSSRKSRKMSSFLRSSSPIEDEGLDDTITSESLASIRSSNMSSILASNIRPKPASRNETQSQPDKSDVCMPVRERIQVSRHDTQSQSDKSDVSTSIRERIKGSKNNTPTQSDVSASSVKDCRQSGKLLDHSIASRRSSSSQVKVENWLLEQVLNQSTISSIHSTSIASSKKDTEPAQRLNQTTGSTQSTGLLNKTVPDVIPTSDRLDKSFKAAEEQTDKTMTSMLFEPIIQDNGQQSEAPLNLSSITHRSTASSKTKNTSKRRDSSVKPTLPTPPPIVLPIHQPLATPTSVYVVPIQRDNGNHSSLNSTTWDSLTAVSRSGSITQDDITTSYAHTDQYESSNRPKQNRFFPQNSANRPQNGTENSLNTTTESSCMSDVTIPIEVHPFTTTSSNVFYVKCKNFNLAQGSAFQHPREPKRTRSRTRASQTEAKVTELHVERFTSTDGVERTFAQVQSLDKLIDERKRQKKTVVSRHRSKAVKIDYTGHRFVFESLSDIIHRRGIPQDYFYFQVEAEDLKQILDYSWNFKLNEQRVYGKTNDVFILFQVLAGHFYDATGCSADDEIMNRLNGANFNLFYAYVNDFPCMVSQCGSVQSTGVANYVDETKQNYFFYNRLYFYQHIELNGKNYESFDRDFELLKRVRHPNILNLLAYELPEGKNLCVLGFECPLLGTLGHFLQYMNHAMVKDDSFAAFYVGQLLMVYYYFDMIDVWVPELNLHNVYVDLNGYLKVCGPWTFNGSTDENRQKRYEDLKRLRGFALCFIGTAIENQNMFHMDTFKHFNQLMSFMKLRSESKTVFKEAFELDLFKRHLDFTHLFNREYDLIALFQCDCKRVFDANKTYFNQ